jgi:hypothetical protein
MKPKPKPKVKVTPISFGPDSVYSTACQEILVKHADRSEAIAVVAYEGEAGMEFSVHFKTDSDRAVVVLRMKMLAASLRSLAHDLDKEADGYSEPH